MKKIVLLGSTGSIGRQSLEVVAAKEDFKVTVLSCHSNDALLAEQIQTFHPEAVVVTHPDAYKRIARSFGEKIQVFKDWQALDSFMAEADVVLAAVMGAAGIEPVLLALSFGKTVALANKETLVAAGDLVDQALEIYGGKLIPVDSEHAAIYQALQVDGNLEKLIITASGGPFRTWSKDKFAQIRVSDALAHPNWSMGQKITIDSATLMNKGLEVIEAHRLFKVDYDRIDVLIHPESIIHSMVEFVDGSVIAQLGLADMRLPIQYALYDARYVSTNYERLNLAEIGSLNFEAPRREDFPALDLAYEAGQIGKSMPLVLNAANEVAVAAFLEERIAFTEIPKLVEATMQKHKIEEITSFEHLQRLDYEARLAAQRNIRLR